MVTFGASRCLSGIGFGEARRAQRHLTCRGIRADSFLEAFRKAVMGSSLGSCSASADSSDSYLQPSIFGIARGNKTHLTFSFQQASCKTVKSPQHTNTAG